MFTAARLAAHHAHSQVAFVAALGLVHILPRRLVNNVTLLNLGRLTTTNSLRMREVPAITIDDITKAVQDEAR